SGAGALLGGQRGARARASLAGAPPGRNLVRVLRGAGAQEIHFRVGSPPITHPCFYGIDTPCRGDLIAATNDVDGIRRFLEVDSLGYLSLEGLLACEREGPAYCHACFSGSYPIPLGESRDKLALEGPRRWVRAALAGQGG